jgi:hypothetical protein
MMASSFPVALVALFHMLSAVHSAEVEPPDRLRMALKQSGGNRKELEAALRKVKGKDTEVLIANASQYDLVNLTAQQIIENVSYARKVHKALPYLGEKLRDDLWREWVLPYRVMDEDLGQWRKDFHEKISPLLVNATTTKEAAETVLMWVGSDHSNDSKIDLKLKSAESRKRASGSVPNNRHS